jgi:molybdate transport system ATP-binding protein
VALARVRVGSTVLLARLTHRAAHELAVSAGKELWVQVKSVALLE